MDLTLLDRLTKVTTNRERDAILLDMSLSVLSDELQAAVYTVAIPHWFDARFLEALLGEESDPLYDQLLQLTFVEQVPRRGYAIHELTRRQLLDKLWQENTDRFKAITSLAADFCGQQANANEEDTIWQAEQIYHRLISDPDEGVNGLRELATKWANYEYHTYEEIEYTVRMANEQIDAGRLTGEGANWTRLWQAKLALIYGRLDHAEFPLSQIHIASGSDLTLTGETAQTFGDYYARINNLPAMKAAYLVAYDIYQSAEGGQLDAFLLSEKLRQEGFPLPERETKQPTSTPNKPSHDALRLIDNIESAWIDGVLKTALNQTIELGMAHDTGYTSNLVYHRPESVDHPIAGKQRLGRLFKAAGGSLLILGAPGSGKTITLLQLLDELLQESKQDAKAPIPLLFNLSSFASFAQGKKIEDIDLSDWLAEQGYNQYRLKRNTTKEELIAGRFVLLLDGLDEVSAEEELREQCVTSINDFIQETPCGLVVCSRIGDYQTLQNDLALAHALVLQPLNNRQIITFVAQVQNTSVESMKELIRTDWKLREVLRSPLLLNLFPQAFPFMSPFPTQGLNSTDTIESRRQGLFAAYVDTVFNQPTSPTNQKITEPFTKEKSMSWLTFLANRMQQAWTSIFNIEELQPTWLPRKLLGLYRAAYGYFHILIISLFVGVVIAFIGGFLGGVVIGYGILEALIAGTISLTIFGMISQIGGVSATLITTNIKRPWLRAGTGGCVTNLIILLFSGLIGLIFGISNSNEILEIIIYSILIVIVGLIIGLFIGGGFLISNSIASWATKIQLREKVKPTRPNRQRIFYYLGRFFVIGLIGGLIFGAIGGLIGGLIVWLAFRFGGVVSSTPGEFWNDFLSEGIRVVLGSGFYSAIIFGIFFGLFGGLFGTLLSFINTPQVDERPNPGSGVRPSLRNAIIITIVAALFFGLPSIWIDLKLIETGFVIPIFVLVNLLPPTFTWFGGLAWCQHWVLRFILSWRGFLPWQLVPWLNEMTDRGLLRRVGGGYIFIHRSLLEYFAALEDGPGVEVPGTYNRL